MDQVDTARRSFLYTSALAIPWLSGCMEGSDTVDTNASGTPGTTDTRTDTVGTPTNTPPEETDTPTPAPVPPEISSIQNSEMDIQWTPDLDQKTEISPEHQATVSIENNDTAPENIELLLEDTETNNQKTLEAESSTVKIPEPQLFNGEQTVKIQYTDTDGETQTTSPQTITKRIPSAYRTDLKNTQGENIGNWNTIYSFDDHKFDREEIQQKRNEWTEEVSYQEIIQDINELSEQELAEKYEGDIPPVRIFFPNESSEGWGHWDTEAFRNTTNIEEILHWGTAVVQSYQKILFDRGEISNYDFSTENDHSASTIERLVNEIYPENGEKDILTTTYVDEGGHGTIAAHIDTDATDIQAEFPWLHIETTGETVLPFNQEISLDGDYNPFSQGYQGEESLSEKTYGSEKLKAELPLFGLLDRDKEGGFDPSPISFADPLLEYVYNEHIFEGKSADPITEMVEKASSLQMATNSRVQVYGDDISVESVETEDGEEKEVFKGIKYGTSETSELYEMSMDPGERLTEGVVEEYFEQ